MQDQFQDKLISIAKIATITVATLAIVASFIFYKTSSNFSEQRVVAITQIVQHPSLDQIRQGILDELEAQGFNKSKKIKIVYENANGNITTAVQIAQKFAALNPEVIVGITTPSAQAINTAIRGKEIPLVFSAVTDPVGANLIKDLDRTLENVTGTVDLPPIKQQIALMKRLVPKLTKIGVVYSPGEINSIRQIEKLENMARKEAIEVVRSPAVKSSEIQAATAKLAGAVDIIYLPNDNAVVAGVDNIVRIANENRLPTIASDDQSTKHGVLASLANNQYQVGRDTGKLVARVLHGEAIDTMPVLVSNHPVLAFNEGTSKKLGIDVSALKGEDFTKS